MKILKYFRKKFTKPSDNKVGKHSIFHAQNKGNGIPASTGDCCYLFHG